MLDAERALAKAGAAVGLVPEDAAARIGEACRAELYDAGRLADDGRAVGNPAEPLVRELRAAVGDEAADYVHLGCDQPGHRRHGGDARLASRRSPRARGARPARRRMCRARPHAPLDADGGAHPPPAGGADDVRAEGGRLARLGARGARRELAAVRDERLAAQLGGAAGTLAALGDEALEVVRLYAEELGLAEPVLPWHTNRQRLAELGAALDASRGRGRRRSAATSCSSRRARWARSPRRRADGPRRCRRSAIPSARRSRWRARAWRTRTPESCSASSRTSTSARWAAGTPSGRRSPARSHSPAER